jgi:hypothetical protein
MPIGPKETRITIAQAAKLESEKGIHTPWMTVYGWIARGVHGVRLETIHQGGKRVTSIEALERFHAACNPGMKAEAGKARTAQLKSVRAKAEAIFGPRE